MNGSLKIQNAHLQRQAIVYLRQSSTKQVEHNQESALNQKALRGRLLELGWRPEQVVLIDDDQGCSGKQAAGREGFQKLVADVSLRKVGIVMGYEASRLSRNCADWHRLLELCSLFDTLIGDCDGIYNPRDFNDRLLLGLKGTMSEAELHSLRLRLDAGRLSKARRGELVQHLPTGYIRDPDGSVHLDPDAAVQQRIRLVFEQFLELGSGLQVLRYLVQHQLKVPRRQTSGLYAGDVLWKEPSLAALHSMLKNPAYAGAFAYGRRIADPTRQVPGRPATGRIRQPQSRWQVLLMDIYPAYITWKQHEQIQATIAENRQKMAERLARKQAIRSGAALLTGLVRCGHCGRAMQVVYKDNRFQYICQRAVASYGKRSCQFLSGRPLDEAVVREFFRVLHPAQIDALEQVSANQSKRQRELLRHLEQELIRLEYAAKRAERQYNCVDPENRLIAATLEKKWENALAEWEQAKRHLAEVEARSPAPVRIAKDLRQAFADVGRRLPEIWPNISIQARKQLLRTLVAQVNLRREVDGVVQVRIVWRGDMVSQTSVRLPVHSRRHGEADKKAVARISELAGQGLADQAIAECLNREGHFPCRSPAYTRQIVQKLRGRNGVRLGLGRVRAGGLAEGYTIREMSAAVRVDPSWIYRKIGKRKLKVPRHTRYNCYLFPRTSAAIHRVEQLKAGEVRQVSFPKEHCDG